MNFLEMCKRVRSEVGVSGDGPANVAGQTGMYAKIVNWVLSAHEEIQIRQPNWRFDWANKEVTLVSGQEYYTQSQLGVSAKSWDFDSMYVYPSASGPSARTWLGHIEYAVYRHVRASSTTGMPSSVTCLPNDSLGLYPIATDGLVFSFDYFKSPEVMVASTDVPRIPAKYHMAIVWRAVMFFCADEENPTLYSIAERNFKLIMSKMEIEEIEGMLSLESLA